MRKIREVLRLRWDQGLSTREVAVTCGLARSTVSEYERRARKAGLGWPLPDVDDGILEVRLFPPPPVGAGPRAMPNFARVDVELRRKGVTRLLLWEEYREEHPDGYGYSRWCDLLQEWYGQVEVSMRVVHKAGERVFVDYSGLTMDITDPKTGEIRTVEIFVGAWGASHYTYCEATQSQSSRDFIMAQVRMLEFYGGAPRIIVPDNLKAAVTKPHAVEPTLNPSILEFARHYKLAVMPARSGDPKGKAVVEAAVQRVQQRVLAPLRNRTFYSLQALNEAIWELLGNLNAAPFQKREGSRASMFEVLDKVAMQPLPVLRYTHAEWRRVRAHVDYHVEIDKNLYSVPYTVAKEQLDARITETTIEVFHENRRVASHKRFHRPGPPSTVKEHMPPHHQAMHGVTKDSLIKRARRIGPNTRHVIEGAMEQRTFPEQAFRTCLGILRLGKTYGDDRLEAACTRAITINSFTYRSIHSILKNHLDQAPPPSPATSKTKALEHDNVRGADYYATQSEQREVPSC